ncbi:MAG: glycoside hydrolase family 57 protein [Bacteroidota bacterium]
MPSVCLYFQLHQPQRLNNYSALDIGRGLSYFDKRMNRQILHQVADRSYLPTNKLLLKLIKEYGDKFKVAFSISGTLLDQLESMRPDVLRSFEKLAETGCVEFLAETHNHSLAFVYSREEFFRQVILHKEKVWQHFRQDPLVFRNTELVYNNQLAYFIRQMGFRGVCVEGIPSLLKGSSPNYLHRPPDLLNMSLLLRNAELADDIAFRFENKAEESTLSPLEFAAKLHQEKGDVVNLFMDYETFGEHKKADTGIFEFLEALPKAIMRDKSWSFKLPTESIQNLSAKEVYSAQDYISWADQARDLSAWRDNELQKEALQKVYELESVVLGTANQEMINTWSLLQASDHFYYMDTKDGPDGAVHDYFRPFPTAYDAYLAYMNVIADFQLKIKNASS